MCRWVLPPLGHALQACARAVEHRHNGRGVLPLDDRLEAGAESNRRFPLDDPARGPGAELNRHLGAAVETCTPPSTLARSRAPY